MDAEEIGEVSSNERDTLGVQWGRTERQDRRKDEKRKDNPRSHYLFKIRCPGEKQKG